MTTEMCMTPLNHYQNSNRLTNHEYEGLNSQGSYTYINIGQIVNAVPENVSLVSITLTAATSKIITLQTVKILFETR